MPKRAHEQGALYGFSSSNLEILRAGQRPHARPFECTGIAREDEIDVVELGGGTDEPVLKIRLPRMERQLAFLRANGRDDEQINQQADGLARGGFQSLRLGVVTRNCVPHLHIIEIDESLRIAEGSAKLAEPL